MRDGPCDKVVGDIEYRHALALEERRLADGASEQVVADITATHRDRVSRHGLSVTDANATVTVQQLAVGGGHSQLIQRVA